MASQDSSPKMRYSILLLCLCGGLILSAQTQLQAQQTTSTITGSWMEGTELTERVKALLVEVRTDAVLQSQPLELKGEFEFHDVPKGFYRIDIVVADSVVAQSFVRVESALTVHAVVSPIPLADTSGITVYSSRYAEGKETTSSTIFTAPLIASFPNISSEKKIESVLLHTPGVVPDEDGRFHVRGEDAQLQYVIDGIPVTANLTRIYSSLFDAGLVSSMEIQTGSLDPEYGVAAAGVLIINTKSGFDAPAFLHASGSFGSYNTMSGSLNGGGMIGSNLSGSLAGSIHTSNRYLDPISGYDPIHDDGHSFHLFGKLDWLASERIDLSLLASFNKTEFEIPDGVLKEPKQDQKQNLEDRLLGMRMTAQTSEQSALSLLAYWRRATAEARSGGLLRIESDADVAKALAENEKFFIGLQRKNEAMGGGVDYSVKTGWFGAENSVQIGGAAEIYPIDEFFTFAVTDSALSSSDTIGGDSRLAPYDLTRGGNPFQVDRSATGNRFSAYIQDHIETGDWNIMVGLRFDHFDLLESENAISPRIAAAYQLSSRTILRASYNRIVMQAPMENILVSSSTEALKLSAAEQEGTPTNVRSEKSHVVEIGASFLINPFISIKSAAYGKLVEDFLVKAELGSSGIIFPVNLKNGLVAGGELSGTVKGWKNLSATLIFSGGIAYGLIPEDGSSPIAAGLIIGEEGHNYSHPFAEEDHFPTEHSQLFSSSLQIAYNHPSGLFGIVGGRLDSGLPFDLTDANGKGLDPEASREELRRRGYSDEVIDLLALESERPGSPDKSVAPHATIDLSLGFNMLKATGVDARIVGTVTNVLDTPYLYKFESSFGGTHFGMPRMASVSIDLSL